MIPPRPGQSRGPVIDSDGVFDVEAYAVMEQRDDGLIASELMHGPGSRKFVYEFSMQGTTVAGISVVGARHLASEYGGISHRIIGSVEKRGGMFKFQQMPQHGIEMRFSVQYIPELENEEDFYTAFVELKDLKNGNIIQVEKSEKRYDRKQDGTTYERPHYALIAQSKAYRNGVLTLIPQDIQLEWKAKQLALAKSETITGSIIEEKRRGIIRYATGLGMAINRQAVETLTFDQISGLSDAARSGTQAFKLSAVALRIMSSNEFATNLVTAESDPPPKVNKPTSAASTKPASAPSSAPTPSPTPPPTPGPTPAPTAAPVAEEAPWEQARGSFMSYLHDETGELVMDPERPGEMLVFTDPLKFCNELLAMVEDAPRIIPAVYEANKEVIDELQTFPETSKYLASVFDTMQPVGTVESPSIGGIEQIQVPKKNDRNDFLAYLAIVERALAAISDEESLNEWLEMQRDVFERMPAMSRAKFDDLLMTARQRVSGVPVEQVDTDLARAKSLIAEIAMKLTVPQLQTWSDGTIPKTLVNRWKTERPDLVQMVHDAYVARKAAIESGKG